MNYYDVLGVRKNATEKEIRQAYRRLVRQYHLDVNSGDKTAEERFKQINEAYSVLSDSGKRRKYDKYGDNWAHADQMEEAESRARRQGSFSWSGVGGADPFSRSNGGPGGIFDQLFMDLGRDLRRTTAEYSVQVTLEEAYSGATRLLEPPGGRWLEIKIPPGVDNGSRVRIPAGADRQGEHLPYRVGAAPPPVPTSGSESLLRGGGPPGGRNIRRRGNRPDVGEPGCPHHPPGGLERAALPAVRPGNARP